MTGLISKTSGLIRKRLRAGRKAATGGQAGGGQAADMARDCAQGERRRQAVPIMWRSFLGWALAAAFCWEAIFRPIIAICRPESVLPPSFMREILSLLLELAA